MPGTKPTSVAGLARVRRHILHVAELPDAPAAVAELDAVWARLGDLTALVEARMRLRQRALPPLRRQPLPPALEERLREFQTEYPELGGPAPPSALIWDAIRALIEAVVAECGPNLSCTFEFAPLGRVDIHWDEPRLTWLVQVAEIGWPGVHVRVYPEEGPPQTFHDAGRVVQHFRSLLWPAAVVVAGKPRCAAALRNGQQCASKRTTEYELTRRADRRKTAVWCLCARHLGLARSRPAIRLADGFLWVY